MVITAAAYTFTPNKVTGPADQRFTLAFENLDAASTSHNLHILKPDGSDVLVSEFFHGPATKIYPVPALTAGTYPFVCDVHADMKGTLTLK